MEKQEFGLENSKYENNYFKLNHVQKEYKRVIANYYWKTGPAKSF